LMSGMKTLNKKGGYLMFKLMSRADSNQYLGFTINSEPYCINISLVREIIYVPSITKVPNVASWVEGVIDLRGKIVRIINFRKWLGLDYANIKPQSRILILDSKDGIFGLLVESVSDVFTADKSIKRDIPQILLNEPEIGYLKTFILNTDDIFVEVEPNVIKESGE